MLLYSCDHGHTVVDNTPDWVTDDPQVEEFYLDMPDEIVAEAWSGESWDYWL